MLRTYKKDNIYLKHILKIVSVFFAVSLWFYVLNSEPLELENEVAIKILIPKGMAISNDVERNLRVRVRGPRAFMRTFLQASQEVSIDITKKWRSGQKSGDLLIHSSDLSIPFGIEVLEIIPSRIQVRLENSIQKKIAIKAILKGEVAPELKLVKFHTEPSFLSISGPKSILSKISKIQTLPIEIGELEQEGTITTVLEELDSRIQFNRSQVINFSYTVKPKKANLKLSQVPIRFLSSQQNFFSDRRTVNLEVLSPEGKDLDKKNIQVIADIPENLSKKKVEVRLKAVLPEGIHLLQIQPAYINVVTNK